MSCPCHDGRNSPWWPNPRSRSPSSFSSSHAPSTSWN